MGKTQGSPKGWMDLPAAQQLILPRSAANASVTRKRLRLRRSENDPAAPESAGVTGAREFFRCGGTEVFSPRARTKVCTVCGRCGTCPRRPKLHIARFPQREESSFISLGLLSHSKPLRWVLNVFWSTFSPEEREERRVTQQRHHTEAQRSGFCVERRCNGASELSL